MFNNGGFMTWGFFTFTHIASLFVGALIIAGLYFLLRKRSDRVKTEVLFVLSFSGVAAVIFNLITWGSPLEYLPLHLCSLTAMVLPFAVITKSRILNNLLLLWSFGAVFALLVNTAVADASIFSAVFVFFYFPHVFEIGIPILMFLFGFVKKDVKCIGSSMLITLSAYTVIHFINLFINLIRYFFYRCIIDIILLELTLFYVKNIIWVVNLNYINATVIVSSQ